MPARDVRGQPKAAPHCDVHEVGLEGARCIGRDRRKPDTGMWTGLGVEEGVITAGSNSFSRGSVNCEKGMSLPARPSKACLAHRQSLCRCALNACDPVRSKCPARISTLAGNMGATPGAHLPTPPGGLPATPAQMLRGRKPGSAAQKRPCEQQPSRRRCWAPA